MRRNLGYWYRHVGLGCCNGRYLTNGGRISRSECEDLCEKDTHCKGYSHSGNNWCKRFDSCNKAQFWEDGCKERKNGKEFESWAKGSNYSLPKETASNKEYSNRVKIIL